MHLTSSPLSLTVIGVKAPPVLLAVLIVSASAAVEAPNIPDETLRAYKAMHKMNESPRSIAHQFAIRCSLTPPAEIKAATDHYGPHFQPYVNVYMNDPAQNHFTSQEKGAYPPGSIVVKEKLVYTTAPHTHPDGNARTETTAIAGLVKHAPGYNAETGDWEFFFAGADGKMERSPAKLASCAECHRNSGTDYVFGEIAKP